MRRSSKYLVFSGALFLFGFSVQAQTLNLTSSTKGTDSKVLYSIFSQVFAPATTSVGQPPDMRPVMGQSPDMMPVANTGQPPDMRSAVMGQIPDM